MDRECGTIICEKPSGRRVKGGSACGERDRVSVPIKCPADSKPIGVSHNHPSGHPLPSLTDKQTARHHNLVVCIRTKSHGVKCYKPARRSR